MGLAMRRNEILREIITNEIASERVVREFARLERFDLVMELLTKRKNVQIGLDYEDIEFCFQNARFIEDYTVDFNRPKRMTKHFWRKVSHFLYDATLFAKSGVFMLEVGSDLSERELGSLADFYSDFSDHFLQNADYFVGIGIKTNPKVKGMRFSVISFYPKTVRLCESCYANTAKYLAEDEDEYINVCGSCAPKRTRARRERVTAKK
jgi:hypothetical protein